MLIFWWSCLPSVWVSLLQVANITSDRLDQNIKKGLGLQISLFLLFLCVCLSFIYLFSPSYFTKALSLQIVIISYWHCNSKTRPDCTQVIKACFGLTTCSRDQRLEWAFFHVEYIVTLSLTAVTLANVLLGWCKSSKGIQVVGSTEINMGNSMARINSLLVSGMPFSEVRRLWDKLHFT